jgi:hypothetical protein
LKWGAIHELDSGTGAGQVARVPYIGEAPAGKIHREAPRIRYEMLERCDWRIHQLATKSLHANRRSRRAIHRAAQRLRSRTRRASPQPQRDAS